MSFSDALILSVAEEHSCSKLVTWNVKHFEARTDIPVKTPEEILTLKMFTAKFCRRLPMKSFFYFLLLI